ncbi:MAG TPA: deoxyribonuclease IV [Candidatus Acidoferrales bacterium]|nr:deoxyribonuclease IV [Candidatus Acidoferrales bacterium]
MRFGIHVGIGGGFAKTIAEALADGCECIQIFAGNPRGWRTTPYDPAAWANFAKERKAHDIAPTVIHTSYLINLAAADKQLRTKSAGLVAHDLDVAARGKIEYVNTHLGSYGAQPRQAGFDHICTLLAALVKATPPGPMLLLENSAGGGNKCGGTLEELGQILRGVGSKRVGVCLDTAHLWASGYDIVSKPGFAAFLQLVDKHIGFDRVRVLHLNDTQVALGAKHDLHWHIGKGRIGEAGFRAILTRPEFAHAAGICETPDHERDRENVSAARRLAGGRRSGGRAAKKSKKT